MNNLIASKRKKGYKLLETNDVKPYYNDLVIEYINNNNSDEKSNNDDFYKKGGTEITI